MSPCWALEEVLVLLCQTTCSGAACSPHGTIVFSWITAPCSSKSHWVTACAPLLLCHNLTPCLFLLGGNTRD